MRSADRLLGRSRFADTNYRRHRIGGPRCRSLFGNSTKVSLRSAKYFGGDVVADTKPLPDRGPGGLNLLSATQAAEKIAAGEATSLALVEECLARIAAREPDIRAWAFIDPEMVRRQARARDRESRRSAFHGVPIGIKDIFDTFDMPTAYGSPIYKGFRPAIDTAIVGLLRRAGLVILGKCATTEFASPVPIGVKNPRDFGRSPGVSSSGSAAAVADYMVPLAVGSQTGGSTILPAAFCGVFGFKASLTGIDRGGIRHLRPGLDTMGLFARDLRDIASLQAIVTGVRQAVPPAEPKGVRVGVCRTLNWHQALPEAVDALELAAKELRSRGALVHDVDMPDVFVGIEDSFRVISSVEGARALATEARGPFRPIELLGAGGAKNRAADRSGAVRQGGNACHRLHGGDGGDIRILRRHPDAKHMRRGDHRSHRHFQLSFQPDLDGAARAVCEHSGVSRTKRHAGGCADCRASRFG